MMILVEFYEILFACEFIFLCVEAQVIIILIFVY